MATIVLVALAALLALILVTSLRKAQAAPALLRIEPSARRIRRRKI